jgi:molybdate transport system substrate-binding protein
MRVMTRSRHPAVVLVVAAVVCALSAAACGDSSSAKPPVSGGPSVRGSVTVLAAASLTESFTAIGTAFETANPGTKVTFGFGASSTLATQIDQGAPADVIATADTTSMQKLVDGGRLAAAPVVFARNRLAVITAAGNPKKIGSLSDLVAPGLAVVLCADTVPCGRFAKQALGKAGVTVTPKSYETDVKAVVTKVTLGEADAGIVYVTDVKAAGAKAAGVTIPDAQNVVAEYPIVAVKAAANPSVADAFVAFVTGPQGKELLAAAGFSG